MVSLLLLPVIIVASFSTAGFIMFLPIALAVLVILVFYVLKRYVVEYVQWFRDVQHMRTLPGPPTKWGMGHMHMVGGQGDTDVQPYSCKPG